MADHQQTAREAALTAFRNSAEGMLHLLKASGAAHAATPLKLRVQSTKRCARDKEVIGTSSV